MEAMEWLEASVENGNGFAEGPRAMALLQRLRRVQLGFVEEVRAQIIAGNGAARLAALLSPDDGALPCAHSLDHLDALVADLLQFDDPGDTAELAPGMVFYQPTPARHVATFLRMAALTEHDTLIDLGSGLGHVPLLAAILSKANCIGVEQDAALVASADACARALQLDGVRFRAEDARTADLDAGTVFYLYSPFTGAMLGEVVERLRAEAAQRPIRIGALGPCVATLARQPWLHALAPVNEHAPVCFRSV